jgi:hypothetical protein
MKLYTYSTARQRLAKVLEEASREGEVQIRHYLWCASQHHHYDATTGTL